MERKREKQADRRTESEIEVGRLSFSITCQME